jgi:hypothetical protein
MAAKLTRVTHKIAIQLHLVADNCTICSSRSSRPVRKLLDKLLYCVSRHQKAAQNHNLLITKKYVENVTKFKYLVTTVTTKNCIHEEIKSRLNSRNATFLFRVFCFPVSSLETLRLKYTKTIILPVVLYECET